MVGVGELRQALRGVGINLVGAGPVRGKIELPVMGNKVLNPYGRSFLKGADGGEVREIEACAAFRYAGKGYQVSKESGFRNLEAGGYSYGSYLIAG